MAGQIEAVTFDLWDTMIVDDSDEPKRRARGLRGKLAEGRHLVHEAVNRHGAVAFDTVAFDTVATAYDVADAAFDRVWMTLGVTWTVRERLDIVLGGLGRELPGEELDRLVARHEAMEIEVPPDAVPGIADALSALSGRYKLAVVSDALITPGRVLRQLLAHHGLERYFSAFAFSDEIGCAKPDGRMFRAAAEGLAVDPAEMVHVGDREHNDIKGAHALGMKAVLFTAIRDADEAATSADAVCRRAADLPAIIDRLAGPVAARAAAP